jgi:hypothetical protein
MFELETSPMKNNVPSATHFQPQVYMDFKPNKKLNKFFYKA